MRLYTIVVSIVAHAAVLVVLVIVPLVAMEVVPVAREATAFIRAGAAVLPDVPPPPQPRTVTATAQNTNPDAAPTRAADRIEPEVAVADRGVPIEGPPGVPGGVPGGVGMPTAPVIPPPPPPTNEPRKTGGLIQRPKKTHDVAPVYPAIARMNGVRGTVVLEAVIGENGRVRNVRVLKSIPLLDQAAIDAVRQWQFTPTLLNGEAVPVVMTVTVSFELNRAP
jgi:periplasmic protein TonB